MFDAFADHIIKSQQVAGGDTFAIRRVGYQDTRLRCFRILLERHRFQFDVFGQACATDILLGNLDSGRVDIRTVAFESELAFLAFVVIDAVEQFLVEVDPFLESELLAVDTRGDVQGDHSRFDQQRTGTAHRVDEIGFTFPACLQNHTGSQYFVQRRFGLFHAVSAFVKAFARTVDRQGTIVVRDMYIDV